MDTSEFEKMEQSGWTKTAIARAYAERFSNATELVAHHLSDAVAASKKLRVLDLCTGHGVVASELSGRGADVTGLDFSPAMISLAQARVPAAQFVVGDAMAMTFQDNSFDAVTIGFGVPHFPDPHAGLAEVARVLKPKGALAFSIWQGKGSDGGFGWLFEAVATYGDPDISLPAGPDAHAFSDLDTASRVLENLSFSDVTLNVVNAHLAVEAPEHLFDAFDQGAVRAAVLLSGQDDVRRTKMREMMAERVRTHAVETEGIWYVPVPVAVVSAILD